MIGVVDMPYTACYTKTSSGYMGQLLEWPEVISEGNTIEECREMLLDAAREMIIVYSEDNIPMPGNSVLFEPLYLPEIKKLSNVS